MFDNRVLKRVALCLLLSLPLACDGSSGADLLPISEQNASQVAAETVGAIAFAENMSAVVTNVWAWMELEKLFANEEIPGFLQVDCPYGGTIEARFYDAPPLDDISAGDWMTLDIRSCVLDPDGQTIGDVITMTIVESNWVSPTNWEITFRVDFQGFTVDSFGTQVAISGTYWLAVRTTDGQTYETAVWGDVLSVITEQVSGTLKNFRFEWIDKGSGDYLLKCSGVVESDDLEGATMFETMETFEGDVGENPHDGEMKIGGANQTTVMLIALDSRFVRLEIDDDGDGTVDEVIETEWRRLGE